MVLGTDPKSFHRQSSPGSLFYFLDTLTTKHQGNKRCIKVPVPLIPVQKTAKDKPLDQDKYAEKKPRFGLIVFKSKKDLDPLDAYLAYASRWDIEVVFNLYKNIIDHDTVNVHTDYRVIATELINFLSTIITSRVKTIIVKNEINRCYSLKQIFKYLSKYKKVRTSENGPWKSATMLKYIEDLTEKLDV